MHHSDSTISAKDRSNIFVDQSYQGNIQTRDGYSFSVNLLSAPLNSSTQSSSLTLETTYFVNYILSNYGTLSYQKMVPFGMQAFDRMILSSNCITVEYSKESPKSICWKKDPDDKNRFLELFKNHTNIQAVEVTRKAPELTYTQGLPSLTSMTHFYEYLAKQRKPSQPIPISSSPNRTPSSSPPSSPHSSYSQITPLILIKG